MATSDSDIDIQVIQEFLDESHDYAETLNKDLLIIESLLEKNEALPEELLNEIFRAAHTIKGTSSFLGFDNIFRLMHNMETLLDRVRKGKTEMDAELIEIVFKSFDTLETLLENLKEEGNDKLDIEEMLTSLKNLVKERKAEEQSTAEEAKPEAKRAKPKKPAEEKTSKDESGTGSPGKRQIVNDTLGDQFLFSNQIIQAFDFTDEMDILKQKNVKNNLFEAYITKENIKTAVSKLAGLCEILGYYKINDSSDVAEKIANEKIIDDNTTGIYLILTGKNLIDELVDENDSYSIREVYHYKESILDAMPAKEKEKFLREFIDNTETQMEEFANAMIKLEEDPSNEELINAAFRNMHTVKGSAGFIGMTSFGETAHKIEDIMSHIREGKFAVTEDTITLLLKGLDALSSTMQAFKNDPMSPSNLFEIQLELDDFSRGQRGNHRETATAAAEETKDKDKGAYDEPSYTPAFDTSILTDAEHSALKEYSSHLEKLYEIEYKIERGTPMKSIKASLVETKLEKEGALIKSIPDIDSIVDDNKELTMKLIYASDLDKENVQMLINTDQVTDIVINKIILSEAIEGTTAEEAGIVKDKPQEAKEKVSMQTGRSAPPPPPGSNSAKQAAKPITTTTVRVDIDKLDSLMNLAGELVITKARFGQVLDNMKALVDRNSVYASHMDNISRVLSEIHKSSRNILTASPSPELSKEYKKIDKLFDSINEYIEKLAIKTSLKEHLSKLLDLDENTIKLGKISSDLQNGIMQTRMVPVENVFSRFRRVVRDLSKSLKKDVKLEIFGEDTELDKKIIDELADPLTHMVRNSLDHGIESSDERKKNGKPETGIVTLSAYHKGNHICIEVSDDGKGIDVAELIESVIKKGLISAQETEALSEKEKLELIFLPGFSSAKEITGVSGRGVGMDVVKKMIESINGSVDITTEVNKGTRFILKIPLTLAIIQALLVVISNEVYAIPLESVIEVIKVNVDDIYHIDGGETIKLREHALSIIDLRDTVGLKRIELSETAHKTIVVVSSGDEQLGIVLDTLIGEQEIVIKSLSEHFSNVKGIVGASVLGDGTISLILDIQAIMRMAG